MGSILVGSSNVNIVCPDCAALGLNGLAFLCLLSSARENMTWTRWSLQLRQALEELIAGGCTVTLIHVAGQHILPEGMSKLSTTRPNMKLMAQMGD